MKTKWIMMAAAAAIMTLGTSAKAIQYTDADAWGANIAAGVGTFSSTFNIAVADGVGDSFTVATPPYNNTTQSGGQTFGSLAGYVPGTKVQSGDVNFWFRNTSGDAFTITVGLGSILNTLGGGPVVFQSTDLNAVLIADLQADGIINYTVQNTGPSAITFDYALLRANVPDGGMTVMLLGGALSGLALLRKKLA